MSVKLSICIPTYHRKEQLLQQLALIGRGDSGILSRIEVLVSDNSTDSRHHVSADEISRNAVPISYSVNEGNIGYAGNLRKLIGESQGEYVWFLSDDDFLYEGAVGEILAALDVEPRINYLTFDHDMRSNDTITTRNRWFTSEDQKFYSSGREFLRKHIGSTCFVSINIFRRTHLVEVLESFKARGIINRTHENMLLAVALISRYGGCYCISKALLCESSGEKVWSYETSCQGLLDVTELYAQMQSLVGGDDTLHSWSKALVGIMTLSTELMLFESAYTRPDFDFRHVYGKILAMNFRDVGLRTRVYALWAAYALFRKHPRALEMIYAGLRRSSRWERMQKWAADLEHKRSGGGYVSAY